MDHVRVVKAWLWVVFKSGFPSGGMQNKDHGHPDFLGTTGHG